jgi:TM2 domain-containing membrane protein YozV
MSETEPNTGNAAASTSNSSSTNSSGEDNQKNRRPPNESDLQAWLKGYMNPDASSGSNTDGAFLSYDWFIVLAVLGGWFGLDHLYLRSPWTFLGKLIVNALFFGIWYFYDIIQAFSSKEVIKVYGVGLPGFPDKRVAMGVLAKDEPGPKHSNFFIYALCLFMGGIFGLDSFLVGDRESGIMRLLFLISIIGSPIAFGWWIYKLFRFFTDTPSVVNQYASYFGSAGGGWSIFGSLIDPASILGTLLKPVNTVADGFKSAMDAASKTLNLGVGIVGAIKSVGDTLANQKISNPVPTFEDMKRGIQSKEAQQLLAQQAEPSAPFQGGDQTSSLNILPYTLLGTIALIALSGFVATYYRSKKHVAPQDDRPPEPGVFRKPDSKEYAA